jgi:hypothetical protein
MSASRRSRDSSCSSVVIVGATLRASRTINQAMPSSRIAPVPKSRTCCQPARPPLLVEVVVLLVTVGVGVGVVTAGGSGANGELWACAATGSASARRQISRVDRRSIRRILPCARHAVEIERCPIGCR